MTALAITVGACNAILGNVEPTLDDSFGSSEPSRPDAGVDAGRSIRLEDAAIVDVGTPPDSAAEAGPRGPDPKCVASSASVSPNAVRRVEIDATPTPVKTPSTIAALFSVYGDNALSNVRLDFCTSEGAKTNIGGGTTFLGGGGAVTRRWQTKNVATLPTGMAQAQVYSDDPPVLRYIANVDLR
ncbi:MAG: hypothetical protein JNL38_13575 [Myxococcales bacterium]|nr:hypothetical protein [Myxococcales bacterium]